MQPVYFFESGGTAAKGTRGFCDVRGSAGVAEWLEFGPLGVGVLGLFGDV